MFEQVAEYHLVLTFIILDFQDSLPNKERQERIFAAFQVLAQVSLIMLLLNFFFTEMVNIRC